MKIQISPEKGAGALLRILVSAGVLACVVPILLAQAPAWWATRGVTTPGATPSDYSAVAQGQVKNMAVAAVNELNADLAQFGGAGDALNNLQLSLLTTTGSTSDYAMTDLGQLKALTQPFYDRLLGLGYNGPPLTAGAYPWVASGHAAADFSVGNIGQLKYLFSFDVTYSSHGIGIPDWWIQKYFPGSTLDGTPWIDPTTVDPDTGVSILDDYIEGRTPEQTPNPVSPGSPGATAVALQIFTPLP